MDVVVQLEPADENPPAVEYRWDTDTDILTAQIVGDGAGTGFSGSMGIEGADGSWLLFDLARGRIRSVEVAVWPEVQKQHTLAPPKEVEDVRVLIPARDADAGPASLEVEMPVSAVADRAERVIHFRMGTAREVRTVRLGRDLLLDVDARRRIAGLWFLNVPPFPHPAHP